MQHPAWSCNCCNSVLYVGSFFHIF